jgi:hypothetical protein
MSESLAGFRVETTDGAVGSVDAATPTLDKGFLVLLPDPRFFAKRLLVPGEFVAGVDESARVVRLSWSNEHLKDAAQVEDGDVDFSQDAVDYYDHELDAYTSPDPPPPAI